jgi:hypothetical protein
MWLTRQVKKNEKFVVAAISKAILIESIAEMTKRRETRLFGVDLRGRKKISVTFGSTLAGALQRCPSLTVLALRRAGRLASHPAIAAQP